MRSNRSIKDSWVVFECQNGNKKAYSLLVKRWHRPLIKFAYRYTNDLEAAKDVVQESWKTIFRKLHALKEPDKFGSWAFSITNRNSINWLRKRKKEREFKEELKSFPTTMTDSAESSEHNEKLKKINNAMMTLPLKQRTVLDLFYIEGFSIQEIGAILQVSSGTVKSRLFHARESIKQQFNTNRDEK